MIGRDAFKAVFMRVHFHKCDKCDKAVTRFNPVFMRIKSISVTLVTPFRNNSTYA